MLRESCLLDVRRSRPDLHPPAPTCRHSVPAYLVATTRPALFGLRETSITPSIDHRKYSGYGPNIWRLVFQALPRPVMMT